MRSSVVAVPREVGVPVRYRPADGLETDLADAATMCFEDVLPYRRLVSYKGQRNFVGSWWFETTGAYVSYESWVERDHVMLMDRAREDPRTEPSTPCGTGWTPTGHQDSAVRTYSGRPHPDDRPAPRRAPPSHGFTYCDSRAYILRLASRLLDAHFKPNVSCACLTSAKPEVPTARLVSHQAAAVLVAWPIIVAIRMIFGAPSQGGTLTIRTTDSYSEFTRPTGTPNNLFHILRGDERVRFRLNQPVERHPTCSRGLNFKSIAALTDLRWRFAFHRRSRQPGSVF